ncbi:cytochrome b561 [Galendromus occidentalis]|uniref:Cytochrome b561 n=1 Tax=Galendromus occidentalis TaxID=34638 RepID=A0AAJ6QY75_9ACAR|nr:cytochrome b561 [Galendromus occidentalis]
MDIFQDFPIMQDLSAFKPTFLVSQVLGALIVILVVIWGGQYNGGYTGPSEPKTWFNWHPVLMTLGFIIIQGDSILVYRVLRNEAKPRLKSIHALMHFATLILVSVGCKIAFDSHNLRSPPIPNLYSLHSWVGMGVIVAFGLQFLTGLACFLYPGVRKSLRSRFMPIHVFDGTMLFILSICAALMGISEKLVFNGGYQNGGPGPMMGNFIGILIVLFGIMVLFLLTKQSYKRIAPAEEQVLPLECSDDGSHHD